MYNRLTAMKPPVAPNARERSRNDDPRTRAVLGNFIFPPFIIMDQGESLREVVERMQGERSDLMWFRLLPLFIELLNHVKVRGSKLAGNQRALNLRILRRDVQRLPHALLYMAFVRHGMHHSDACSPPAMHLCFIYV